jgi:hypothetical protein
MLFHHYKELIELKVQVEQMGIKVEGLEKAYSQQLSLFDF